ncbi:hypothetical protein [Pseudomonas sp. KB-10]|uniref:hypothetical protein n=1 Tax=Pseudomonas sp. KB-10 TaxID=2292264 RepID=UPI001BB08DFD|nr:hypothetical protein [Pseudomonas sp. KB-10]
MQIPSLISSAALATSKVAKSAEAGSDRGATSVLKTADDLVTPASVMAVSLSALSRNQKAQVAPGMSMSQLDSMVQTSLKMQAIRNDASIPEEVKKRLLAPLEKANKDVLDIANTKAEQEEKEKIIEASSEDAAAIREAGKEIDASLDAKETMPASPAEPAAVGGEEPGTAMPATAIQAPTSTPKAEAPSTGHSASSADSSVGRNLDTQA